MKAATFNTNSIRARMPIIKDWLAHTDPDVLCLQETKVQDKDFPIDPLEEAGYQMIFKGQKSYNGVAIISKHPLVPLGYSLHEGNDDQARFISARIGDIPVINTYVPQGTALGTEKFQYKLTWLKDLLSFIKRTYTPHLPLLLTGDFNVALEDADLYDPQRFDGEVCFHPDERALMAEYFKWGFVDVFRKHNPEGGHYTFWDYRIPNALKRNLGWRLDYILTTKPLAEKSKNAWIDIEPRMRERPSDHTFLIAEFDI
jgi:exodeoxyribonuclease-3